MRPSLRKGAGMERGRDRGEEEMKEGREGGRTDGPAMSKSSSEPFSFSMGKQVQYF